MFGRNVVMGRCDEELAREWIEKRRVKVREKAREVDKRRKGAVRIVGNVKWGCAMEYA